MPLRPRGDRSPVLSRHTMSQTMAAPAVTPSCTEVPIGCPSPLRRRFSPLPSTAITPARPRYRCAMRAPAFRQPSPLSGAASSGRRRSVALLRFHSG